jgi:hypothetical protein
MDDEGELIKYPKVKELFTCPHVYSIDSTFVCWSLRITVAKENTKSKLDYKRYECLFHVCGTRLLITNNNNNI